jgi:glycosyltransferase involved in cell wall biosynthesis
MKSSYIVITPARDEEKLLPQLIQSMTAQTCPPARWIVIDDGSTDATAAILDAAAEKYPWIEPQHLARNRPRAAGGESVVMQFLPLEMAKKYDYVLRLDADLTFEPDFAELLLKKFYQDRHLGIAGPTLWEPSPDNSWHEIAMPEFHTRGAAKMYSSECFIAIGGLDAELGWDTLDEARAMMLGFHTRSFRDIKALHHRPQGAASGWKARIAAGESAYKVGYSPLFMLVRSLRQTVGAPFPFAGVLLMSGYLKGYVRRVRRSAAPDLVRFIRQQQIRRLLLRESLWR